MFLILILSASAHTAGQFWAYSLGSLGWSLLGTFRALWGAIGTLLGHSVAHLGHSLGTLGALLGHSWTVLALLGPI